MKAATMPAARSGSAPLTVERYLRWMALVVAILLASSERLLNERLAFMSLSAVMVGYGASEIVAYCKGYRERWISPVVVASILLFILPFGLTNLLYLLPESDARALSLGGVEYKYLVTAQLLALLGLAGMWLGYRSSLAVSIGATLRSSRLIGGTLQASFSPSMVFVAFAMGLCIVGRLALIRLGLFGYSSEAAQFTASAGIAQWVRVAASMGSLVLAILALAYYGTRRRHLGLVLALWMAHEVLWGVLAAFKSSVILPFIIVGACHFVVDRRLPRMYLLVGIAAIVPAYGVVEPLRYLRFADPHYDTRSVEAIADAAIGVARGTDERAARYRQQVSLPLVVASRLHLATFAARAIEFEQRGPLPPDSPPFLRNLLLAPFYAVAPRALLPSKATATTGVWFSTAVLGWGDRTSVGMSAVGYLYLAGGAVAVLLGFVVLGILQRTSFEWLFNRGSGALLVYLVALIVTANVDPSEFWAVFTTYIRYVPLAFVAQALAFRR